MMKSGIKGLVLIGCLYPTFVCAADQEIFIKNHQFSPAQITIKAGDTVTWVNRDQDPHNVVDKTAAKKFRSPALDTEDRYSFHFDNKGTYSYFCTFHPTMVGAVIVE